MQKNLMRSAWCLSLVLLHGALNARTIAINSDKAFDAEMNKKQPMAVKFFATWCPPCQKLKPVFEKISDKPEFSSVSFLSVDVEKAEKTARTYSVRSMPTTVFIDAKGKEVDRIMGGGNDYATKASDIISSKLTRTPADAKEARATTSNKEKTAAKKETPAAIKKAAEQKTTAPKAASTKPKANKTVSKKSY